VVFQPCCARAESLASFNLVLPRRIELLFAP
jgi:hypothetical protein